jgi:hypothetical protein
MLKKVFETTDAVADQLGYYKGHLQGGFTLASPC